MTDATLQAALAGERPDRPVPLAGESDLDALVAAHDRVLVEFYTEGCGICASMEPVLGIVARATDAVVALCNPRDDPPLVERFDVRSVPTLVLFEAGVEVDRLARGFVPSEELVAFVETGGDAAVDGAAEDDEAAGTPLDPDEGARRGERG